MNKIRERVKEFFIPILYEWHEAPGVLKNKIYILIGLLLIVILAGLYAGLKYGAEDFFILSACLSLAFVFKVCVIFRVIMKRNYCSMEGVVLKVKSRLRLGRFYRVTVLQEDGTVETLLIDKNWQVNEGGVIPVLFSARKRESGSIFLSRPFFRRGGIRKMRISILYIDENI